MNDETLKNWVPLLMNMTQASLVAFAVGGAFLSLAYFDLCYYIVAIVVLVDATVRESRGAPAAATPRRTFGSVRA
jgi:hypothetical protein